MGYYKLIEHTADLGINVRAKGIDSLFTNSASAMFDLIAGIESIKPVKAVKVIADAKDMDELLKNWLSELLYFFNVKNTLFSRFEIEKLSNEGIISIAKGEDIDKNRHSLRREIKAVTFHRLKIRKQGNGMATDIIFDV